CAHTAWKNKEGFAKGTVQIVQTSGCYLWVAPEAGFLLFDGVRAGPWPPPGQHLPSNYIPSVAAGADGALWIGTAKGLVSRKDGQFIHYSDLDGYGIHTLLADHEGTIWIAAVKLKRAFSVPGNFCNV